MAAFTRTLSDDQRAAFDRVAAALAAAGADLGAGHAGAAGGVGAGAAAKGGAGVLAVTGRAGSGKTLLLAALARAARAAGVEMVSPDWEGRRRRDRRTLAVLAPTNKAAAVLRGHGIPATTIHRILYTPVYDPRYERIVDWLAGLGTRPAVAGLAAAAGAAAAGAAGAAARLTEAALDRAKAFYDATPSVPGALAAIGLSGSDFIVGWERRKEPLDIGFVDEASMLDSRAFADLRAVFPTLVLFGDPAQLAPVGEDGTMVFEALPPERRLTLSRIHRQAADNPILDLAHALADPALGFPAFEALVAEAAARDGRVVISPRVSADLMARSPVLVWRNRTRVCLIRAFRTAHGCPPDALLPGEPLICDSIELPLKHRRQRIDLEARGLVKGAQVIWLGPGRTPGFSRLHVLGAEQPQVSAASIIKIEQGEGEEPVIPSAARMGAVFLHGAAVTVHKAQGSQWDEVQVFAPDLFAAAASGREEAGTPLWKRLAYVAVTRAQTRLHWITGRILARPTRPLGTRDLAAATAPLALGPAPEP